MKKIKLIISVVLLISIFSQVSFGGEKDIPRIYIIGESEGAFHLVNGDR